MLLVQEMDAGIAKKCRGCVAFHVERFRRSKAKMQAGGVLIP